MFSAIFSRWLGHTAFHGTLRRSSTHSSHTLLRPRLEELEGRLVPTAFLVNTTADVVDPGDGRLTLREAIDLANATPAADTIRLGPGAYKIALAGSNEDANARGDFDITAPLTIQGAGAAKTILDGRSLDRVFHVVGQSGAAFPVAFNGMTIRNGFSTGPSLEEKGGAIYAQYADVALAGTAVRDNTAMGFGGGICVDSGDLRLVDSTVRGNSSRYGVGGGINTSTGSVTLVNSTVSENRAEYGAGGIRAGGEATVVHSILRGNKVLDNTGGGILANNGLTLTDSLVSDNDGRDGGGGLDVRHGALVITNSTIRDNTAATGGGIRIGAVTSATLTNVVLRGNTATDSGGGIAFAMAPTSVAKLTDVTVTANTAGNGGGLFHSGGGTVQVKHSVVAGNTAAESGPDVYGVFVSLGRNRIGIGDGSTGFVNGVNGDRVGTAG